MSKKITQEELNNILWSACDTFRGSVDEGKYKDYILMFLFYKYLSDKHKKHMEDLISQYGDDKERIERKLRNDRFIIPNGSSFDDIFEKMERDDLGVEITKALHSIEEANGSKIEGMFTNIDFNSESDLGRTTDRNRLLRNLIQDFAKINLKDVEEDIIGESYIYLISKFASGAGKKAGEFFSPRQLSKLLSKLAQPKAGDRICDPTMGSGSLLLLAGEEVEAQTGKRNYSLYGQESNGSTYQLARMNMFLHGKDSARLEWGDTLNNPLLKENDELIKFDVVVANPPFSLDKWGAENAEDDKYDRFWRGVPPKSKGDYAFISHMVEIAKAGEGRVAVIAPHGVLFRGSSEKRIRQKFIEENLLDAVIGLPAGLFQSTGIPVCILVFDRSREQGGVNEKRKDVMFIDASKEFKKEGKQNHLEDAHLDKIIDTYQKRKTVEKYSYLSSLKEIEENDFNLNIPRYVDTFEEEEIIDLAEVQKDLKEIDAKIIKVEAKMKEHLKNLEVSKNGEK